MSAEQPVEVRHYDSSAPSMSEEASSSDREEAAGKQRKPNRFKQRLAWNEMGQNRRNVNIRRITYDVVPTTADEAEKLAGDLASTTVDQRLYVRDEEEVEEAAKLVVAVDKQGNIAVEDEEGEQRLTSSGQYLVCRLRRTSKKPHETEKQGSEAGFREATTAEDRQGTAAAESPTSPSTSTAVSPKDDELPAVAAQPSTSTEGIEERQRHHDEEYEAWQMLEEQEYDWFHRQLDKQVDQEPKSTHEEVARSKKELQVKLIIEEKEPAEEEEGRETEAKKDDEQQQQEGGSELWEVEQQEEECQLVESSKWSLTGASTEDEDSEAEYRTTGEDLTQSAASSVQVSSVAEAEADGRQDVDKQLNLHDSSGKEEEQGRKVDQDEENEALLEAEEGEQPAVPPQRRRIQLRCNVNLRLQVRSKDGKKHVKAKLGTVHINDVRVLLPDP